MNSNFNVCKESELTLSESAKVVVSVLENQNKTPYLSIRIFYLIDSGKWLPSNKGIVFRIEDLDFVAQDVLQLGLDLIEQYKKDKK